MKTEETVSLKKEKKTHSKQTSERSTSATEKTSIKTKDIISIIKAAAYAGAAELKYEGLEVKFTGHFQLEQYSGYTTDFGHKTDLKNLEQDQSPNPKDHSQQTFSLADLAIIDPDEWEKQAMLTGEPNV